MPSLDEAKSSQTSWTHGVNQDFYMFLARMVRKKLSSCDTACGYPYGCEVSVQDTIQAKHELWPPPSCGVS